jgi:5-methylcytosine-specific restriction enzyme subunit McrC
MTRETIELGEYKSVRRTAAPPSAADLRLADQLAGREGEPRLIVRWLSNGDVDITSNSWIGVVHFSQLEIRVVPKLVGGALRVLRMLEYASGVDLLKRLPVDRPLPASGADLFDLICLLLAEETQVLVRDGLLRGYRPVDEPLEVLRGRLRYRDQCLRRFGQLLPLECHFDEYDSNIPENQLLSAALTAARGRATDPGVRSSIMRLVGLLTDSCEATTTDPTWYERTIRYDRRNARYRPAHELSLLVLRSVAFDDIYDTSSGRVGAFLLDMNVVFEKFITRLVEEALESTDLSVDRQSRLQAVIRDDTTGRSYAAIRPDLVIRDSTGRSVPVDIKYKLYDTKKVAASDVYQLFMYAYALGAHDMVRRVGLMYPAATPSAGPLLSVKSLAGPIAARITGTGLDIPAALDSIASKDVGSLHASIRAAVGDITGG